MAKFDIFNPTVSKVIAGIEGKVITLMGNNSTGKTFQATKLEKPYYLAFEKGLGAIAGVPYANIENWEDFMQVNRLLTNKRNREKVKETYSTIIFDEVYTASMYCQDYICRENDVNTIADIPHGKGWSLYASTFWSEIDKLLSIGLTIIFIVHTEEKDGQFVPKGDKRSVKPVIDNSDVVAFLRPNGMNEETNTPIPSSAFFIETPQWFARTRFEHMVPAIKEFSAENLIKAIEDAIKKSEEETGIKSVSFDEKKELEKGEKLDYDEILTKINTLGKALVQGGFPQQADDIVRKNLGMHKDDNGELTNQSIKPNEIHPNDVDKLYILLLDLQEFADENNLEAK